MSARPTPAPVFHLFSIPCWSSCSWFPLVCGGAAARGHRALREFRIRGVKTNIGFLENVLEHPTFVSGQATVGFIDEHPELFQITRSFDRATKTLRYIANLAVNGISASR